MDARPASTADFEQPFEVLDTCHGRIQRMLSRLQWLHVHLTAMGRDAQARQAARDVMRCFDLAAPTHHEDEERHVFPPLLAAGLCVDVVVRLQREHLEMAKLWPMVREVLQRVDADRWPGFAPADEGLLEHFARLHDWHIATEDELVYPAAAQRLEAAARIAMGQEMARRRGIR
jgi:hemerythrin-like domain-containing protein